ncbi:MAG: metal ABC transporter substrate-binding protein, partial [Mycobacteriales bacterium]
LVLLGLLAAGCTSAADVPPGKVGVVASAYPFAWLAQQVGGSDVVVRDLVPPGAEPHDLELSPRQVGQVEQAAVVVYLKGFQPAVDDALQGSRNGFDLGTVVTQQPLRGGSEATAKDPHVWLDPVRMEAAATALGERLAAADPGKGPSYRRRAAATVAALKALDATFAADLRSCARTDLVTSHSAFGYLAARYGLVQVGISGLDPEAEPSPAKVAEVAQFARAHRVTTIFFESLVDPKVAQTVAGEIGARTAVLDPVEGVRGGDDYLSVQRRNASALHLALGCA